MPVPANLHLEIQAHRSHHYGILRSSFRANGKVKHANHGRAFGEEMARVNHLPLAAGTSAKWLTTLFKKA